MKKQWLAAGGSLAALAFGYWGWSNQHLLLVSDVTTGESVAYPKLRSRVYYAETERVMAAAEQAIRRLPRWNFVARDAENDALEASFRVGPFTHDVTVYVLPLGHGQTGVTLRSRSRLGLGDLGRNAARIRQLQQAMDDRLNAGAAF